MLHFSILFLRTLSVDLIYHHPLLIFSMIALQNSASEKMSDAKPAILSDGGEGQKGSDADAMDQDTGTRGGTANTLGGVSAGGKI